ncbi:valyl-tRNA synthetase [Panacagrimonas perspica]|uniref:Valine--tRNA ligase n=1 Tax=Panacagrimonas perspica TaxID=381431 RepID=A0A4S3KAG4_9GAMM|nr:valine--tRNA ligase [Panacagrimonas perspica]TDU32395.1 valyl-tRNA synthetase [Panacagrimonas perspica]THD05325.1 valine--tRNA ligase [Panacagrimonas perspica]
MDKTFEPGSIEARWRAFWEDRGCYAPSGQGEPYSIMIPPPNVTGTLHMGHAFQHTIMDALIRHARMSGRDTLWQMGTDHAGIATQMVVERNLKVEGIARHDLGREKFVDKVWEWKAHSGGIIEQQIRRLGSSVDWNRNRFTMDEGYSKAVVEHFVKLHEAGLIYRGKRLVNWDPVLQTAISDLEVVNEEENGKLWHFRYPLTDGSGHLVVATTRPETMLGDTAVAVHPEDERYRHLIGRTVRLPLADRDIPVIADDYVDREFGTGVVKITPAHDFNDYQVGQRHKLALINILTPVATLNDDVPQPYRGLDRYVARKKVVADLDALGLVDKIDDHKLKVPRGDRSGAVLEPYLTDQWFVDLTRKDLADGRPGGWTAITKPALDVFADGRIKFVPENWINTYRQWLDNIQDWCISRQLWWGHRIPAWYDAEGNVYVGRSEDEVRRKYPHLHPSEGGHKLTLTQDNDVFDTWFSSDIWPMATLDWPAQNEVLKKFYPSSVLVTGFDIIFFWVARMVMMGQYFMQDVPFHEVYITGLVRDPEGNKMSKSKGNILDPLDVVDGIALEDLVKKRTTGLMKPETAPKIEAKTRKDYPKGIDAVGTDALRFTFAALATQGRDIRFDAARAAGYRNFCNKIWNAARYVLMNCEGEGQDCGLDATLPCEFSSADRWIVSRLQKLETECAEHFRTYRFDLLSTTLYQFIWNEYCDWYLELSKPALQSGNAEQQRGTRRTLLRVLETWLRLLHPLMPFITEEVWQRIAPLAGVKGDTLMLCAYPVSNPEKIDERAEADIEWLKGFILGVRQIRGEMDISPAKILPLLVQNSSASDLERVERLRGSIEFLARVEPPRVLAPGESAPQSASARLGDMNLLVPMAGLIDKDAEVARLARQIEKLESDLEKVQTRIANPNFGKAPEAVQQQARDLADKQRRDLAALREQSGKIAAL